MTDTNPTLVVLGIDAEGKPHASWFAEGDAETATRAAGLMKFHAVRLAKAELKKLASELPPGRVFASGKAFCPFVKRDLYDKFAALVGTPADAGQQASGDAREAGDQKPVATNSLPAVADPWASIGVGSIVLATAGRADGWWESIVLTLEPSDDTLTLTWMPSFRVPRRSVAVLGPEAR